MITLKEFCKNHLTPDELKQLAIVANTCTIYPIEIKVDSTLIDVLGNSFYWRNTPQGQSYWEKISTREANQIKTDRLSLKAIKSALESHCIVCGLPNDWDEIDSDQLYEFLEDNIRDDMQDYNGEDLYQKAVNISETILSFYESEQ